MREWLILWLKDAIVRHGIRINRVVVETTTFRLFFLVYAIEIFEEEDGEHLLVYWKPVGRIPWWKSFELYWGARRFFVRIREGFRVR